MHDKILSILLLLVFNSLFIFGLQAVTYWEYDEDKKPTEKKLLWFISYYAQEYYYSFIHKPLITCAVCMSSFYGAIFFLLFTDLTLFLLPVYCITLAGLNSIIYERIS